MKRLLLAFAVLSACVLSLTAQTQKPQSPTLDQLYLMDLQSRLIPHYRHPSVDYLIVEDEMAYGMYVKSAYRIYGGVTLISVGAVGLIWCATEAIMAASEGDEFDDPFFDGHRKNRKAGIIAGGITGLLCIPAGIIIYKDGIKLRKKAVDVYNDGLLRQINQYKYERELSWKVSAAGFNLCFTF